MEHRLLNLLSKRANCLFEAKDLFNTRADHDQVIVRLVSFPTPVQLLAVLRCATKFGLIEGESRLRARYAHRENGTATLHLLVVNVDAAGLEAPLYLLRISVVVRVIVAS